MLCVSRLLSEPTHFCQQPHPRRGLDPSAPRDLATVTQSSVSGPLDHALEALSVRPRNPAANKDKRGRGYQIMQIANNGGLLRPKVTITHEHSLSLLIYEGRANPALQQSSEPNKQFWIQVPKVSKGDPGLPLPFGATRIAMTDQDGTVQATFVLANPGGVFPPVIWYHRVCEGRLIPTTTPMVSGVPIYIGR